MTSEEIKLAVLESLKAMNVEMTAVHAGAQMRDQGEGQKKWECDAWRITFTRTIQENARITHKSEGFDYYTGIGHRKAPKPMSWNNLQSPREIERWKKENAKPVKPDAAGVLYSLVMDASANDQSFNDWCADYGYDTDSRKAFETYQACCDAAKQLNRLFSRAEQESLRELLQDY